MRVLHLIPSISPLRGGPSLAVMAMTAALRYRGVDARVLTTNDHGPGLLADLPLGRWQEREGVPVLAFGRWSPPIPTLREFAIAPALSWWLWRNLSRFDLLHVHALFSYPSTSGMAIARSRRVPYLLRSIGQLNHWSLAQSAGRKQLLLRLIERRNLAGAAALHFTSAAEQQEAGALAVPTHAFVLPLGVPLPDARGERAVHSGIRFLFLSRLHPKKQLELLFEALALLLLRCPDAHWRLQIAGEGEPGYERSLRQLAKRLGLAPHLDWLGFVSGAAKQELLQAADWFVLPSASENFGIAAAEALAAATPVLLAPGVALAENVHRAGAGRVVPAEVEAWTEALVEALEPPSPAMRAAARNLAASAFSWRAIARDLQAEYVRILARS
jgi:glycosyltransferase involved in cell wall biosynthesis